MNELANDMPMIDGVEFFGVEDATGDADAADGAATKITSPLEKGKNRAKTGRLEPP